MRRGTAPSTNYNWNAFFFRDLLLKTQGWWRNLPWKTVMFVLKTVIFVLKTVDYFAIGGIWAERHTVLAGDACANDFHCFTAVLRRFCPCFTAVFRRFALFLLLFCCCFAAVLRLFYGLFCCCFAADVGLFECPSKDAASSGKLRIFGRGDNYVWVKMKNFVSKPTAFCIKNERLFH